MENKCPFVYLLVEMSIHRRENSVYACLAAKWKMIVEGDKNVLDIYLCDWCLLNVTNVMAVILMYRCQFWCPNLIWVQKV
jgi:hypothetical protein